jgi:hypothetical protein
MPQRHGVILGVAACVLSVPYDMPGWLPEMVTVLARFHQESWPIRGTVTKTVSEFRRTHLDTWEFQQHSFTEEQLEVNFLPTHYGLFLPTNHTIVVNESFLRASQESFMYLQLLWVYLNINFTSLLNVQV